MPSSSYATLQPQSSSTVSIVETPGTKTVRPPLMVRASLRPGLASRLSLFMAKIRSAANFDGAHLAPAHAGAAIIEAPRPCKKIPHMVLPELHPMSLQSVSSSYCESMSPGGGMWRSS